MGRALRRVPGLGQRGAEGAAAGRTQAGPVSAPAVPIGQVPIEESRAEGCGVPELDRVLGGGLVPGAVVLLAGEPGVGKSTLLLEVAAQSARRGVRTLYVSGEESAAQVRLRADRCRGVHHDLYLAAESDLGAVLSHVQELSPGLLVVDSVQTVSAPGVDGVPGGVSQVKEVTAALVRQAKSRGMATLLVGHVTKDGTVAGPRVLEHLVDVVLSSRVSGPPGCAWCAPRRTASARSTRSAASTSPTTASPRCPTRPGSSCPVTTSRCPAPA